jgi:hypothetical protein
MLCGKLLFNKSKEIDIPILESDFKTNSLIRIFPNDVFLVIGSQIKNYKFVYYKCLYKGKFIYIKSVFFDGLIYASDDKKK